MPLNEARQTKKKAESKIEENTSVDKNVCSQNSTVHNLTGNNKHWHKLLSMDNYMRYLEMRKANKKYKLTCAFDPSDYQSLNEREKSSARPVTYRTYSKRNKSNSLKHPACVVRRDHLVPETIHRTKLISKPSPVKIQELDIPKDTPTCVARDKNEMQNEVVSVQTSTRTSNNMSSSLALSDPPETELTHVFAAHENAPLLQTLSSSTGAIKRTQPSSHVAFNTATTTSNASTSQIALTSKEATNSNQLPSHLLSSTAPATTTSTVLLPSTTIAQSVANTNQISVSVKSTKEKEIMLSPEMLNTYYKLLAVVPHIDHTYMKETCLTLYNSGQFINSTDILEHLINHMLEFGDEHINVIDVENEVQEDAYDVDERYEYLSGIFPDADPKYLSKVAKRLYDKPEAMMEYIQSQWKDPNYPTKEEILERTKVTEQQKWYATKFDVKKFVGVFPDPFAHFEDPKRKCKFNADALEFLKHRFNRIKVDTISGVYTQKQHHLTLTAQALESIQPDMKFVRYTHTILTENIPVLQECAFISHKAEIKEYVTALKVMEVAEFEELKERNELLECLCCYDNECMPSKCSTCDDAHIFCNSCIIRGTEARLAGGNTRFPCFLHCDSEFSLSTLQRVLPPTQFSILLHKWQAAEVTAAGMEDLVSCPFCHFATIPPPGDKVFKCFNPECMKESCRKCKELNHVPFKCYEQQSDKARLLLEEKMTEALVRKCSVCLRPYFKEDGCNKITCPCGIIMCYICDKVVSGYDHFDRRGEGTRCPLMSNNKYINAEVVRQVAEKTIKQIKEQDANVTVNADRLLAQLSLGARCASERIPDRANRETENAQ